MDLGHYERFTGVSAHQSDNVTSGRIYQSIITRERRGDYLGATVQVIPHVTDAIKAFAVADTDGLDFVLCEIGGTVGDIESLPFMEALRQLRNDLGRANTCFVHLTLVPYIAAAGELKTKPTQHSVRDLTSLGIQPDVLVCRCEHPLPEGERAKIALFCNVPKEAVIPALDAPSIYAVPIQYSAAGLDAAVLRVFGEEAETAPDLRRWHDIVERVDHPEGEVTIGVVGKYVGLADAYKSLNEALVHGGLANRVKVNIRWLDAEMFEERHGRSCRRQAGADATRSWCPAASASVDLRARSPAFASRVSGACPISASVSACRWRASKAARNTAGMASGFHHRVRPDRRAGGRPHHRMDDR